MARRGDSQKEMVNAEGTDKYAAGTYKTSDGTLLGPIYGFIPSEDVVITSGKDKDGVALYLNYITNAVTLLAGELYFFRLPVIEIIFTGSIQVLYVEQSKRIA